MILETKGKTTNRVYKEFYDEALTGTANYKQISILKKNHFWGVDENSLDISK